MTESHFTNSYLDVYKSRRELPASFSYDVLDALSSHIAVIDDSGCIVHVNSAWLHFARNNSGNLSMLSTGVDYLQACRAALRPEHMDTGLAALHGLERLLRGEVNEFELTYPCNSPEQNRWFLMRCTPMRDSSGHIVICHINITEKMQMAEALRKREEELEAFYTIQRQITSQIALEPVISTILEQIMAILKPDLAMLFLREGEALVLKEIQPEKPQSFCDKTIAHQVGKCLCGLAAESGKTVYSTDIKTDNRCTMNECKEAGFQSFASIPLVDDDIVLGCIGLASTTARDFRDNESFLDAIACDITLGLKNALLYERLKLYAEDIQKQLVERQHLEQTLVHSQKLEAIGHLAGGIAHDFNNILAAIMGFSELALQKIQSEESREYIAGVLSASHRAKDLIQQILTFSRKSETRLLQIDLCQSVNETVPLIRASLPSTITIHENFHGLDSAPIFGNPTQLQRLLLNLSSNGAQAMEDTGGALILSLRRIHCDSELQSNCPELELDAPYFELAIRDTGTGIPAEHLTSIFDPYFSTKVPEKGTGLGLAVVHGIVKSHNGGIAVRSFADHGTTFLLYFPENYPRPEAPDIPMEQASGAGSEHIMVVDDEQSILKIFKAALQRKGYTATCCSTSREALMLMRNSPQTFDLVICDLTLPDMPGNMLAEKIRSIRGDIPIALCTGHVVEELSEFSLECIDTIIQKPVSQSSLIATIRTLLD